MSGCSKKIAVGITGASGAVYAVGLLEVLLAAGHEVHLSISPSGAEVIQQELDLKLDLEKFQVADLMSAKVLAGLSEIPVEDPAETPVETPATQVRKGPASQNRPQDKLYYHHYQDFYAPIASGSFLTEGMVVCPCSGTTLSAIAHGMSSNLIQRAAEVHLKERRKLIVVPRETPLSVSHIENMLLATQAGAIVMPASPGWYHGVTTQQDLIAFMVARICDQLGVEHDLMRRWGGGRLRL